MVLFSNETSPEDFHLVPTNFPYSLSPGKNGLFGVSIKIIIRLFAHPPAQVKPVLPSLLLIILLKWAKKLSTLPLSKPSPTKNDMIFKRTFQNILSVF